jgi:hypothetical protein
MTAIKVLLLVGGLLSLALSVVLVVFAYLEYQENAVPRVQLCRG